MQYPTDQALIDRLVEAFLARALEATGSEALTTAGALVLELRESWAGDGPCNRRERCRTVDRFGQACNH